MDKTLKQLRLEIGLSQDKMAKELGMSTQNWRNYESGALKNMKPVYEEKLSELFGFEYHYRRD